jgi:hypothetical protein
MPTRPNTTVNGGRCSTSTFQKKNVAPHSTDSASSNAHAVPFIAGDRADTVRFPAVTRDRNHAVTHCRHGRIALTRCDQSAANSLCTACGSQTLTVVPVPSSLSISNWPR